MSFMRRLKKNKRGISGVISGLFILIIALAIVAFIFETYQVQTQMSDWDSDRVRERIEASDVFFGGVAQYSPNSVTPSKGPVDNLSALDNSYLKFDGSKTNRVAAPIENMNFSIGSSGWNFDSDPGSRNVQSGYSTSIGNSRFGSSKGSIFSQMTGLLTGPYWMNWTCFFSYSEGKPESVSVNWARYIWSNYLTSSAVEYVVLTLPNGTSKVALGPTDLLVLDIQSWYYRNVILSSDLFGSSGTYALTLAIRAQTLNSGNPHDSGNLVVFYDDAGISFVLGKMYTTDFYGTINTGRTSNDLRRLQINYAGSYVPWLGTLSYSPSSLTTLGNTSVIGGSYQNLAAKDGSAVTLRSYRSSTPIGYNPLSYNLLGGTALQSGSIGNLSADDGIYQSFKSYLNASETSEYVDYASSDVDSSPDFGTHSNFTAQLYGPDSIFDTLTEQTIGMGGISLPIATGSIPNDMASNVAGCMGGVFFNPSNNVYTITRFEFNASSATNQIFNGVTMGSGISYPTTGWVLDAGKKVVYWTGTLNVQPRTSIELYADVKGNNKAEVFNITVRITANSTVYSNSYITEQINANAPWSVLYLGQGPTPAFAVTTSPNTQTTFYISLEEDGNQKEIQAGGTLTILVPPEFKNIQSIGGTGWGTATITGNKIEVGNLNSIKNTYRTYAFNATAPANPGLYILNASFSGTPNTQTPLGNFSIQVTGATVANYQLDLEEQWTNVDFEQDHGVLCIRTGTLGSEALLVQYWTGSSWSNLFSNLNPNSWNNVSVPLTGPTFTIRFKGSNDTSDTTQDSWQIDATLLYTWTNKQVMELELTGASNTNNWASINWTLNSAWSVAGVSTTLQLYNSVTGQYPSIGDGYVSYLSGTPNIDQTQTQTISANPTNFRDSSGNWKIKITGSKENATQFTFLCDLVVFTPNLYIYQIDWYGQYSITDFNSLEAVSISYWAYYNSSNISQTMYIFNFQTSEYDQLGTTETYVTAGIGQWHNHTINSNLDSYVNSSTLRIRILAGVSTFSSFDCSADCESITVSGGGAEGSTATQRIYIMDFANNRWHQLDEATIADRDQMEGPIEISDNASNYIDSQGTILMRVYSEANSGVSCKANLMMIRVYYFDPSKIALKVTNLGSDSVNLVRVWVDNATGHTKVDLVAGTNIDRANISPGEQALIQINYPYSTSQYTFKVVTKRGTIAAYVKTAS